jgi:hypothetical protein
MSEYSIINFTERYGSYKEKICTVTLEFTIKQIDFVLCPIIDHPILEMLRKYNVNIKDILTDNMLGLS